MAYNIGNLCKVFARSSQNTSTVLRNIPYRYFVTDMSKPSVYITRQVNKEAVDLLKEHCQVTSWTGEGPVPREELLKNIENKDALFCMLTDKIDAPVLDKAGKNLKVVATMSVGYDHLDTKEIKKRNIKMGYTPDTLTDATAELAVALLLATSRRLLEANKEAKTGGWHAWSPFWMCGPGLKDSTVGIVGFGRIGQQIARILKAFNPKKIIYYNRSERKEATEIGAERVSFDELLSQSDFISVSAALTPDTHNMFNEEAFRKMKSTAVFINTSRGGLVDQDALVAALQNKVIWGAGLDVMTPEPLPLDHPLFKLKNCVILPHIGSAAIETRNEMGVVTAKNIIAALNGVKLPFELIV
ncbi:glyoxylate reductase/hydroxypyruvate reductase [Diabrotica virgifera virgifera]|uniref:Glyoxylate reductase/hydroxypyruvate reductase n=1 Tax=Diabrotica virgifera virgifera TaxID=50390 RepID=A0A6P7GBT6_DIAVI|nr:glyoxylate reductase/hydroxypyruvate reductase [Diabrotica virgifera virgifera]